MKAVLAVLLCVAIALAQQEQGEKECDQWIQDYYSCIDNVDSSTKGSNSDSDSQMSRAEWEKQISDCFTQASCKDPMIKSEGSEESDADMAALQQTIGSCLRKMATEEERPLVEECVAKDAGLNEFKFRQQWQSMNNEIGNLLLSVVDAVYNDEICSNDKARDDASACLEQHSDQVFPPTDEEECKKNQLGRSLSIRKKQWTFVQGHTHCLNNVSKECRKILEDIPQTACDCAQKLFERQTPKDLHKKFEDCVTSTLDSQVSDRLGDQVHDGIADAKKNLGDSFCPTPMPIPPMQGGPMPPPQGGPNQPGQDNPDDDSDN